MNLRIVTLFSVLFVASVVSTSFAANEKAIDSQIGKVFKDCEDCPEMVVIPAGSFDMGGTSIDLEKPVHRVSLAKPFAIGKYEVTQAQWQAVMGNNPSSFTACGSNCPVDQVSWDDVQQYIKKLNLKTGKNYRLPSEAEWEYACRAGQKTEYCGGNDLNSVGWYGAYATPRGNSEMTTHSVGQKYANAFGLYDMSGNVLEWVQDNYHENYNGAPSDGSVWQGGREEHVIRGGSWSLDSHDSRAASRGSGGPMIRIYLIGFRLAKTLP